MADKSKRKNIYFRQTPKEFRAQKLAQIIQHFRTNLPYRFKTYAKNNLTKNLEILRNIKNKKFSKKIKV